MPSGVRWSDSIRVTRRFVPEIISGVVNGAMPVGNGPVRSFPGADLRLGQVNPANSTLSGVSTAFR